MKRAAAALAALSLLMGPGAALARVMIPQELQAPSQYLEIVREKKPCTRECFVEYILLSNGVMVKKQFDTQEYDEAIPAFSVRRAGREAAGSLLGQAAAFFGKESPASGSHTDPDNLYFYDGEKHYAWSGKEETADFSALYGETQTAYTSAALAEDFYLHQYYQPLQGGTQALHIFTDGTIITSVFDRLSYRMIATSIARLNDEDLEKTKALAARAQAAAPGKFMKCAAETGLEYGLVEFINGGNIQKSYTCGTGSGDIPALFSHVRALSSG